MFQVIGPPGSAPVWDALGVWAPHNVAAADLTFGVGSSQPLLWLVQVDSTAQQPEQQLARARAQLEGRGAAVDRAETRLASLAMPATPEAAYANLHPGLQQLLPRLAAFTSSLSNTLNQPSLIHTELDGVRIASTFAPLLGRTRSVFRLSKTSALHLQAVDLVIRSRTTLMQLLTLMTRIAGLLARFTLNPVAPVAAAVAVWRTVNAVLQEGQWLPTT